MSIVEFHGPQLNDRHLRSHGKIGDCEQSIQHRKSAIQGLPVTLLELMLRVKMWSIYEIIHIFYCDESLFTLAKSQVKTKRLIYACSEKMDIRFLMLNKKSAASRDENVWFRSQKIFSKTWHINFCPKGKEKTNNSKTSFILPRSGPSVLEISFYHGGVFDLPGCIFHQMHLTSPVLYFFVARGPGENDTASDINDRKSKDPSFI